MFVEGPGLDLERSRRDYDARHRRPESNDDEERRDRSLRECRSLHSAEAIENSRALSGHALLIGRSFKLFSYVARLIAGRGPSLYDALRHHPHRILQGLSLVAEPDSYNLPVVSQPVRQGRDLVACNGERERGRYLGRRARRWQNQPRQKA